MPDIYIMLDDSSFKFFVAQTAIRTKASPFDFDKITQYIGHLQLI